MEIKCTGNNGNGCFLDSFGHNCDCEGILKNLAMQGRRANNTKFLRALIYNFGKKLKTENDGNKN